MANPTPAEASAELLRRRFARASGADYREYVSGLKPAAHSRLIWGKLHDVMDKKINRLMVFCPPGSAKTLDISHHFPAFYLSKFQNESIIAATHTDKFAEQNGRRVRNIVASDEHQLLFPGITVSEESSAAARWETSQGGMYAGFGVGATVVGRRAQGLILDDVVAGISAADSPTDRDFVWNWFGADLVTRLTPGGWIVLVMTRYNLDDIAGRLLAAQSSAYGDKWEVVSLPALAKPGDILGRAEGEPLWPEWQNKQELLRIKNQPHLSGRMWSALYQQEPVAEGGNVIKREWFKFWKFREPPECKFVLQSWDTAVTRNDKSAWSACTTWGIFDEYAGTSEDMMSLPLEERLKLVGRESRPAMILLGTWRGKLEYPELRKMATRLAWNYYDDNYDMPMTNPTKLQPDTILIEKKSSGESLIQDLNRAGIMVRGYNPNKDGTKDQRLELSLDFFDNGRIWVPAAPPHYTMPRRWAGKFIDICVSHPSSDSRDVVDCTSQAIIHIKRTGWVHHTDDPRPKAQWSERQTGAIY